VIVDAGNLTDLRWVKARGSQGMGMCIEIADRKGDIFVRDSKDPSAGALRFSRAEFGAFVEGCRQGEFDSFT
jgi:hypothetical protein